ncbi:MAG: thioesterase family protein [Acidimicrobiales bacterium]|jgi:acyl-CoA thioesterase|nr:thioesterase family protein [Acidimicrobiales bacterium]
MPTDVDFLGLVAGETPGRHRFTVVEHLCRLDGRLYGGAAIAVSIAAAEVTSQRPALWMTTQFVSTVERGDAVDVHTEVLAAGRRTEQVRVTATGADGAVVFASLGATGRHRPDGLTGQFERRPTVQDPQDAEPWETPFSGLARAAGIDLPPDYRPAGFATAVELREPRVLDHPDDGPGRVCLWMRRRDGASLTPATVAYLADMVPMGVAHALGVLAGGVSLDNTIRIGPAEPTEWMLLDLRPHLAVGGYGHGIAHVWSEDGHLLATASQTASMLVFDPRTLPGTPTTGT